MRDFFDWSEAEIKVKLIDRKERSMRDSQKSKVYRVEGRMRKKGLQGQEFYSLKDIDNWVNKKVLPSPWFKKNFPKGPGYLEIRSGKQEHSTWAYGSSTELRLPEWARNALTVLHEISHGTVFLNYGESCKHNWQFTKTFLALVKRFMADEVWRELKRSYVAMKIKHRKPPQLSIERLMQLQAQGDCLAKKLWGDH